METSVQSQLHPTMRILIDKTEEIYLKLGNRFPELFKELESGFDASAQVLSYFLSDTEGDQAAEGYGLVSGVIREAKAVFNKASSFFLDMKERDESLFDSINRSIKRLAGLEEIIENIREYSIEMELISLNAMTAALKAGVSGKAFSYITEELKKLSTHTIEYTADLTKQGLEVLKRLYQYRKVVEEIQSFQRRFYGDFKIKLNESFEIYNQGVKKLAEILFEVIDDAKSVKKPLYRIMEEVQLQDIIKQSVEHVIISVGEINTRFDQDDPQLYLDEVVLMEQIPQLSINLLEDVKLKIKNSLQVFRKNFAELKQVLERVEAERSIFLEFLTKGEAETLVGGALNQMFADSVGVLEELLSGIDSSMEKKKKIGMEGHLILEGLGILEERFKIFFEIVDRFYSIAVASKIEIAKQEDLRDREDTVTEMIDLTQKIEEDVKTALQTIKDSLSGTGSSIRQYGEQIAGELQRVTAVRTEISESYDRLVFSKTTLADTLKSFSVYNEHFYSLIEQSEGGMVRLDELIEVMNGVQNELAVVREEAKTRKEEALEKSGIQEWQIKNNRMKDIIGRFTIFTHKKDAGELGGFEVEEGSNPGELTLF